MTEILDSLASTSVLGNSLLDYCVLLLIILTGIIFIKIFKKKVLNKIRDWAATTETTMDDFIIQTIDKNVIPLLYYGLLYTGTRGLILQPAFEKIIKLAGIMLLAVYGILFLSRLIDYSITTYRARGNQVPLPRGVITLIKVIIWTFGVIFMLDNLGFEVSTVIAGLGISGVAVALASQTILKDLFNYFVILFDRPFEKGDFIVLSDSMGTVDSIGIKTTKILSPGGEQIIISNSELTGAKIRNYMRMARRTVKFDIGVSFDTPNETLKKIPEIIKEIIFTVEDTQFDRAHFKSFGSFSLDFEVLLYLTTTDYYRYMDILQEINLKIKKAFEEHGIEMPYPTEKIIFS